MKNVFCSGCGSVYQLKSMNISSLENDIVYCDICNTIIHKDNTGKIWNSTLIEEHTNHLKSTMAKQEKKTPEEASNIFHNIMKASVIPKKADKPEKEKKPQQKPKK